MSVAFPFVSHVSISALGVPTVPAMNTTSGNQLVVGVVYQSASTVTSLTDTASNTYTQCGTQVTDGGSNKIQLWRAFNITGNSANVVTLHLATGGFTFSGVIVYELTMVGTSDPFQNTAGTNGNSTTASTGNIAVSGNTALIGIAVLNGGTAGGTAGTLDLPFWQTNGSNNNCQFLSGAVRLVTTTSPLQVQQGTSTTWGILGGSFTVAGASGGSGGGAWAYA